MTHQLYTGWYSRTWWVGVFRTHSYKKVEKKCICILKLYYIYIECRHGDIHPRHPFHGPHSPYSTAKCGYVYTISAQCISKTVLYIHCANDLDPYIIRIHIIYLLRIPDPWCIRCVARRPQLYTTYTPCQRAYVSTRWCVYCVNMYSNRVVYLMCSDALYIRYTLYIIYQVVMADILNWRETAEEPLVEIN